MIIDIEFFRNDLRIPSADTGKTGTAASFRFEYDASELNHFVFQMVPVADSGIVAARAKYRVPVPDSLPAGVVTGTVEGTLTLIEFKTSLQDIATFGGI